MADLTPSQSPFSEINAYTVIGINKKNHTISQEPPAGTGAANIEYYQNRGYCTIHNTVEVWKTAGAPGNQSVGHSIVPGSRSYLLLP